MSTSTELKPPAEMFNGDNLPDDLKWIMSDFGLPKEDPTVVFCAWHWDRLRQYHEMIQEGAGVFRSVLDPRIEKIQAYALIIEKMRPGLDQIAEILGQDEATLKGKLHASLQQPVDQIIAKLEKFNRDMEHQWWELTWKQWLACFTAGLAAGVVLTLCVM